MTHYPSPSRIYNIRADSLESSKLSQVVEPPVVINNKKVKGNNAKSSTGTLGSLLVHYDTDSENEESPQEGNKLDAKVDDFLQEINQLSSDKPKETIPVIPAASAWQACVDETTGYPYYWNVKTNEVTWQIPKEYEDYLKSVTEPSLPVEIIPEITTKTITEQLSKEPERKPINNITQLPKQSEKPVTKQNNTRLDKKRKITSTKSKPPLSDSEDEKIVMITSYSEDSSTEEEIEKIPEEVKIPDKEPELEPVVMGPHIEEVPKEIKETTLIPAESKKEIIEKIKDEKLDETIILSRLRTQAKVLQELGGELPKSVDKSIIGIDDKIIKSLSLVAGYGDDSEHSDIEEEKPIKSLFPIPAPDLETIENEAIIEPQSTLFPATQTIDVKQFEVPEKIIPAVATTEPAEVSVENKVYNKRKKRLGITFDVVIPTINEKRTKLNDSVDENTHKGFGFEPNKVRAISEEAPSVQFRKAGIAFIKADTLKPSETKKEDNLEDFEEIKDIVTEKVTFLGEGKDPVSAVQIMSIQLQTLEAAYTAGGLTRSYLFSWLRETFSELGKLEQEAAPTGWQCEWDRLNKRYFYRNQQSGESQWDYPEPADIIGGGEAMDICTTPPPHDDHPVVIPSPPIIRDQTPSPPPTPIITPTLQPPLPPTEIQPPPPPIISIPDNQPLPPGVDSPEIAFTAENNPESKDSEKESAPKRTSFGSELDSFYSEIASINPASSETIKIPEIDPIPSTTELKDESILKKKKKTKVRQGINMKKKHVSSLVEKWKKVQNDYL